jgi:hypothetical protein
MRVLAAVATAGLITVAASAAADTVASTIQAFGLVGTWSDDCGKPIDHGETVWRLIFTISNSGIPTRAITISDADGSVHSYADVLSASITGEKIRLTLRLTGGDMKGGPLPMVTTNTFTQDLAKIGGWLRFDDQLLDKCSNPGNSTR